MMQAGQEIRFHGGSRYGGRLIVPVVRASWIAQESGAAGLAEAVALLWEEEGTWYFIPLAPWYSPEDLRRVGTYQELS